MIIGEGRCPKCGMNWVMFPPARIEDIHPKTKRLHKTGEVRCVECKTLFNPEDLDKKEML